MKWFFAVLLVLGGIVCCLNFYVLFLDYQLYRLRGGQEDQYHGASGVPFLGSLLVLISLHELYHHLWILILGVGLLLVDLGGPLWFVVFMISQHVGGQDNR